MAEEQFTQEFLDHVYQPLGKDARQRIRQEFHAVPPEVLEQAVKKHLPGSYTERDIDSTLLASWAPPFYSGFMGYQSPKGNDDRCFWLLPDALQRVYARAYNEVRKEKCFVDGGWLDSGSVNKSVSEVKRCVENMLSGMQLGRFIEYAGPAGANTSVAIYNIQDIYTGMGAPELPEHTLEFVALAPAAHKEMPAANKLRNLITLVQEREAMIARSPWQGV